MPLRLIPHTRPDGRVEAINLTPTALSCLSAIEVARLPVQDGNRRAPLGTFFRVEGNEGDGRIVIAGDAPWLHRLGQAMDSGEVCVDGSVGDHLGAGMAGGRIDVAGSIGHYGGAEMRGGAICVRGHAGDFLGAAGPGQRIGMRQGVILVHGNAGHDIGLAMRRGLIAIAGDSGDRTARALVSGSVFVLGRTGSHAGIGMKRGTLATWAPPRPESLVVFRAACRYRPTFLGLYLAQLARWGLPVPPACFTGPVDRYNGDVLEGGHGELLVGGSL